MIPEFVTVKNVRYILERFSLSRNDDGNYSIDALYSSVVARADARIVGCGQLNSLLRNFEEQLNNVIRSIE